MIDFVENGNVIFSGSKVAAAANGFIFDVSKQIIENDNFGELKIIGLDLVKLGLGKIQWSLF